MCVFMLQKDTDHQTVVKCLTMSTGLLETAEKKIERKLKLAPHYVPESL